MLLLAVGRDVSALLWAWSGQESSSDPESVFLLAALWDKGGSDVVAFIFSRLRPGRTEQVAVKVSLSDPPIITCFQAELASPTALFLSAGN